MTSESRSADDELPDIVDIVRDIVEALPPALPAHLEQLANRARTYVEMAIREWVKLYKTAWGRSSDL